MIARFFTIIVLTLSWVSLDAQEWPHQRYSSYEELHNSINSKGVCTINGDVFYGIDCWCYSSKVGTVFITTIIILFVIFFFINGCIWACIFHCYKSFKGRRDRDDDFRDIGSLRSSTRSPYSIRKSDIETPIR